MLLALLVLGPSEVAPHLLHGQRGNACALALTDRGVHSTADFLLTGHERSPYVTVTVTELTVTNMVKSFGVRPESILADPPTGAQPH